MRRMITDKEIEKIENLEQVSGTNDGTNWTSLTIGDDTYGLASGGGTTYTAGNGIDITSGVISVDNTIALKSEIPTVTSDLTNDSGYITGITSSDVTTALGYTPGTSDFSGSYTDLTDKPDLSIYAESSDLATVATTGAYSDLSGTPTLATVATSGDYTDLTNKPTIPAAQVNSDWNASSGVAEILNKPSLATVATSGAYSDLTGTPTIPDAVSGTNDGTNWTGLTIGSDTYAIPAGGGSSYTFTNGLTESSGTVSWDLNNEIIKHTDVLEFKNVGLLLANITNPDSTTYSPVGKNSISICSHNWNSHKNYTSSGTIAVGADNTATGSNLSGAIVCGYGLKNGSSNLNSLTIGQFNDNTVTDKYLIIGNGTSTSARANALTVDKTGILECTNVPAVSGTDGTYQLTATTSSGTTTYSWDTAVATNRPFYNGVITNDGMVLFSKDGTNYTSIVTIGSGESVKVDLQLINALSTIAPSTAGTYTLQCTVDAQGNKTYNWV